MSEVINREILKTYFRSGAYPTEAQFAALIDSLRHKNEPVQIDDVERLASLLNDKYSRTEGQSLLLQAQSAVADAAGVVGRVRTLEGLVGAPVYGFDRVIYNETTSSAGPAAVGCKGGEVALFLNEDCSVAGVYVCDNTVTRWVGIPRDLMIGPWEPDWTPPACLETYAPPEGPGGIAHAARYILRRGAMFIAAGAQSVTSASSPPEDFAVLYVVDDQGNLLPLSGGGSSGITDEVAQLKELIIRLHATITASVSPTAIYKGVNTNVSLSSSAKFDGQNLGYELLVNGAALANPYTINDRTSFAVKFQINNADPKIQMTVDTSVIVNAYYPIYYGFGATASEVIVGNVKLTARASALATYSATNTKGKDCYFFILVPTGVTAPTAFSMGGAPASLNQTEETLNGISYKVFKTGGIYAPAAELKITAS